MGGQADVYGLGDDNCVVNQVKGFPKVNKSESRGSFSGFQVFKNEIKETNEAISGGRGSNVAELPLINFVMNSIIRPAKYKVFTKQARDWSDSNGS